MAAGVITAAEEPPSGFVTTDRMQPHRGTAGQDNDILLDQRLQRQAPLQQAVARIQDVVAEAKLTGLAGLEIDDAHDQVIVHWAGAVPAPLAELVSAQAGSVVIRDAPFTSAELLAGAKDLADHPPEAVGVNWSRVGPLPDFTGLQIVTGKEIPADAARGLAVNGIPVRIIHKPETLARANWRWGDTPAFYGGAAIDRPVGDGYSYCTTAFPVRLTFPQEGLLTAEHCGNNVDWRGPVNDVFIGRSQNGNAGLDVNIITGGSSYAERIYVGPWDADISFARVVGGTAMPAVNNVAIPSGSWSGASVTRVTEVNQFINLDGHRVGPGFWAVNDGGVASVGQGDSGGPTATTFNGGTTKIRAMGIISAIDRRQAGPCVGVQAPGRECSRQSFHVNVIDAAIGIGATVKTG